jgi:uncharacterized protein with von Willebrand factor type A (vWA) domain
VSDPAVFAAQLDEALRRGGVRSGTRRAQTLAESLRTLPPASRDGLYWMARAAMLPSIDHVAAFDRAFAQVAPRNAGALDDLAATVPTPPPEPDAKRTRSAAIPSAERADPRDAQDAPTLWLTAASQERLAERDFDAFGDDELARMLRLIERARVPRELRRSRRRRAHRRGDRFDLALTLRGAARTAGELVRRRSTRRRERLRPLVFLLDVSGSMAPFARALVQYARVAARGRPRVRVFAFATRLTDLTALLRNASDATLAGALGELVRDYGGGTQIGANLREFNDRYAQRGIARGGTVIILSDGWERGDPSVLAAEMARLRRLCRRIVWVNPHKRHPAYEPLVAGMAAALPSVDLFVSGHNLRSLDAIAELLATSDR